mgnify:FL=1
MERLQETKVIQQAKCLLLEHEHMNEQQAHKYLEKKAMNARLTRLQLAKAVIRKYENKYLTHIGKNTKRRKVLQKKMGVLYSV